jgi:LacI family transcriptional regulator
MTRAKQNRPTLKTIAELTGLAVPTISRALNDAPDIGQKTKERVRAVADEIGYVRNRAGVRLRTGRNHLISLILGTEIDATDHIGRLTAAIAAGLQGTPYHLSVTPYFRYEDRMKPLRFLVESGSVDALILNQIETEDPRVAYLMERQFPFVTFGRTRWKEQHAYYDFDNMAFAQLAVDALHRSGRQRIALLAPPKEQNYARDMVAGAVGRAERHGMAVQVISTVSSEDSPALIQEQIRQFLRAEPQVDGVVCSCASAAMAVIVGAERAGHVLGQSIDVASKEAVDLLRHVRPEVKTIHEDVRRAGVFLAKAAIKTIEAPTAPPMQRLDAPSLRA